MTIFWSKVFLRLQRRAGAAEHSPQLCLLSLLVQTPLSPPLIRSYQIVDVILGYSLVICLSLELHSSPLSWVWCLDGVRPLSQHRSTLPPPPAPLPSLLQTPLSPTICGSPVVSLARHQHHTYCRLILSNWNTTCLFPVYKMFRTKDWNYRTVLQKAKAWRTQKSDDLIVQ